MHAAIATWAYYTTMHGISHPASRIVSTLHQAHQHANHIPQAISSDNKATTTSLGKWLRACQHFSCTCSYVCIYVYVQLAIPVLRRLSQCNVPRGYPLYWLGKPHYQLPQTSALRSHTESVLAWRVHVHTVNTKFMAKNQSPILIQCICPLHTNNITSICITM